MDSTSTLSFPTTSHGTVSIRIGIYDGNEAMAVELYDNKEEFVSTLSVNIPEFAHELRSNEFFAKTWSENADLSADALASCLFEDTGRTRKLPWVIAPIWRLRGEAGRELYSK